MPSVKVVAQDDSKIRDWEQLYRKCVEGSLLVDTTGVVWMLVYAHQDLIKPLVPNGLLLLQLTSGRLTQPQNLGEYQWPLTRVNYTDSVVLKPE